MNEKMILEKLRFISEEFFIIFTSAMLIWALIGTLPVHAEEASTWNISSNTGDYSCMSTSYSIKAKYYYKQETNFSLTDDSLYYAFVLDSYDSSLQIYTASLYAYRLADTQKPYKYRFSDADAPMCYGYVSYTTKDEFQQNSSVGVYTPAFTLFKEDYSGGAYTEYEYETQLPIFESVDAMYSYCLTGDKSGMYSEPASPDVSDESYTYTGFSMNGKTASWTGTTQRSHLLDQDVEEYTTFTYGFASSEDQTVSSFIEYDGEYATADKKLKLPWDEMEAKKKDGEFIRQVNITPCYRVPGAFYRGVGAKVYFHKDGSIDKIELPSSSGTFSSDMERPIIVLNEGSNGKNPLEGDYSYFRFNNAQDDYYIEMKGRWYSTNDFDLYKENLVWKYKYQTILKNDLSTWVSVSDNVNSVGAFKFDVLGKTSWENLLSLYPVDDRNYEGGSFALMNKITGYSDALDTLKMLLKQPYSLYNGYEVYVRYYRYADDGGIQYSKWTHFYNNLANAGGSSGSRLDDLDNMYSENQSEKGLTDDQLSDLENSGNSRNDTDAVPKNNYDYSSLENATMNFFDMLKNYGSLLGEFPSMVASVFGFLPSWLIAFIGIAIGAVIVCRFIGR